MQSQLRWFLRYRSVQSDYLISTLSAYCVLNVSIYIVLVPCDFIGEETKAFIKTHYHSNAGFLNLRTLDIVGQIALCCGAVLCMAGCEQCPWPLPTGYQLTPQRPAIAKWLLWATISPNREPLF